MAMTVAGLKARFINKLNTIIKPKYINIPDNHQLTGYDYDSYNNDYFQCIAEAIVEEIQANAKATGLDSRGDTHNLDVG